MIRAELHKRGKRGKQVNIEFINEFDEIEILEKFPEFSKKELMEKAEETWELMRKFHPYLDAPFSPNIDLKIEIRPLKREGKKFMRSHLISNFSEDEKDKFIDYILELYRPKKSRKTGEVRVIPSCLYFSIFALDNKLKRVTGSLNYAVSNQTIARAHCTQIIGIDLDGISKEEYQYYKEVLTEYGIMTVDNFSGHGYQLFVLLDQASTDLHLQHKAIDVLREVGIPADIATIDCGRIMRIPFINSKYAYKYELVKCIRLTDTDKRYSLEEFFACFGYKYVKPKRQLHQKRFNVPGKNIPFLKDVIVDGQPRKKKDGTPWPIKTYKFEFDLNHAKTVYQNYPFKDEDTLTILGAPKYSFNLNPLYLDTNELVFDPETGEIAEDNAIIEVDNEVKINDIILESDPVEDEITHHTYKVSSIDLNYYPTWINIASYPPGVREMFCGFRQGFADNTLMYLVILLRKEKLSYDKIEELMVLLAQLDTWDWAWDVDEVKRKTRYFFDGHWYTVSKQVYSDLEREFGPLSFRNYNDKVEFFRNKEVFISNSLFTKRGTKPSIIHELSKGAFRLYLILLRDSHLHYLKYKKNKQYTEEDIVKLSSKSRSKTVPFIKELTSSSIKLLDKKKNNRRNGEVYHYYINDISRKKTNQGYMHIEIAVLIALESLMKDKIIKENAAMILFYVIFRMQSNEYVQLSQQHIADMLGLTDRTVRSILTKELAESGYVTVITNKKGIPNGYIINL